MWLGRSEEGHEELRCVLAVVRHGDRTPKQKMKMKITQVCIPRTHDMLLCHLSHLKAATKEIDQRTQGCQLVETPVCQCRRPCWIFFTDT